MYLSGCLSACLAAVFSLTIDAQLGAFCLSVYLCRYMCIYLAVYKSIKNMISINQHGLNISYSILQHTKATLQIFPSKIHMKSPSTTDAQLVAFVLSVYLCRYMCICLAVYLPVWLLSFLFVCLCHRQGQSKT